MSDQVAEGRAALELALEIVEAHANALWKEKACDLVNWIAHEKSEFTTDEVWEALERFYPSLSTHEPRAMGAVMRSASRSGIIVPTDRTTKTIRPLAHRRPVRVWSSLVY